MRSTFIAPLCIFLSVAGNAANALPPVGPTVRDVVEFKRIIQPYNQDEDALPEQVSPDGKRAFIVTRQAEVDSDTNRYEILLFDVTPDHLAKQGEARPETIFSVAVEHDSVAFPSAVQNVQWHGDGTLVMLARLKDGSPQVYSLDVHTRQVVQLTHEANPILSYAASQDLQRVVYSVQVPNPPLKAGQRAVVVGRQSFWGVKFGQTNMDAQDYVYQNFVTDTASSRTRPLGPAFPAQVPAWPVVSIPPDGRWALLPRWEPDRLAAWAHDYPRIAELWQSFGFSRQNDPLGYFSTPKSYLPRHMVAWHLDDATEKTILDTPDDALPGYPQLRADRVWQGTGESVVLAGTYLPLIPGSQESTSSHVIEYWPQTGRWADIATLHDEAAEAHALPGGFMVMDGKARREFKRRADGGWSESPNAAAERPGASPSWTLHIVQGLNQPQDVYARGPSGESRRLTALNPQFDAATWGSMQRYTWHDAKGRAWEGGLMAGADMDAHTRYPLLIQTYGFSPDRFFLDGTNLADGATSAFAGRAFLREGILVLQMPLRPVGGPPPDELARQQNANDGVRGAIDALVKEGRVDPNKVGIMGWSAWGKSVLNLVTFSDLAIRAATVADGDANTTFNLTVAYGRSDGMLKSILDSNEGPPFGGTLPKWVRNDPSLHTDCIRSALRIETYGPWVLANWDVYALLRQQYKPVEMVVIPNGEHSLSIPSDRMVSLQGNVDWYAFWLAGKSRTGPLLASETAESLSAQYANWRQMESLKAADDARPRCVR
jgi:dipeptidyl aminopeptidase/acylaminoacyl peptidase